MILLCTVPVIGTVFTGKVSLAVLPGNNSYFPSYYQVFIQYLVDFYPTAWYLPNYQVNLTSYLVSKVELYKEAFFVFSAITILTIVFGIKQPKAYYCPCMQSTQTCAMYCISQNVST